MRKLRVFEFLSLDGVMQAPGQPDEDTEGGFEHGGWQQRFSDEVVGRVAGEGMAETDALLLGRRTYEIFARHWPTAPKDDMFTDFMNRTPKFVASTTLHHLEWENSTLLEGDVGTAVKELKQQPGGSITVLGSGSLLQTLLAEDLVDELGLALAPIVLGSGKRLFRDPDLFVRFDLVDSTAAGTGSLLLTYRPAR